MVEITNKEEFDKWLEDKPAEWVQLFAMRLALRVLPMAFGNTARFEGLKNLRFQVIRSTFISWAARRYPAHDMKTIAGVTAASTTNSLRFTAAIINASASASFAVAAASYAVGSSESGKFYPDTVNRFVFGLDNSMIRNAAVAAADAAANVTAHAKIWGAIKLDAAYLEQCKAAPLPAAQGLVNRWLWVDENGKRITPDWYEDASKKMMWQLADYDDNWLVWAGWYNAVTRGDEPWGLTVEDAETMVLRIVVQEKEWWERGASAVNADIVRWLDEIKPAYAQNGKLGNRWHEGESHYEIKGEVSENDRAVASDPKVIQAHRRIREKIEEFSLVANTIEDTYDWQGFGKDFERFSRAYDCDNGQLAENVEELYDTTVTFGSFLQMDNDLQKRPQGNMTALGVNHRRQFEDLIRSTSPWIRRFPTAREIDAETGSFLKKVSASLADSLISDAGDKGLVTDKDRALIKALLAAMERNGLPAAKAGIRGYFSVKNLVLAAALTLSTAVVQGSVEKTKLYDATTDWLASRSDEVMEIIADSPADIRAIIEGMLKEIEDNPPQDRDKPSGRSALGSRDRRRKKP